MRVSHQAAAEMSGCSARGAAAQGGDGVDGAESAEVIHVADHIAPQAMGKIDW